MRQTLFRFARLLTISVRLFCAFVRSLFAIRFATVFILVRSLFAVYNPNIRTHLYKQRMSNGTVLLKGDFLFVLLFLLFSTTLPVCSPRMDCDNVEKMKIAV